MQYLTNFIGEFTYLFLEMAPWLLFGFLIAGMLHVFMPEGIVEKYMGQRNLKSVFYASLLGVPLPLCSCGVIPTGISFHKEGASKGATVSFLISTPQTGVDSILATYSLMGLPFALLRPVVAFLSGIFGGVMHNLVVGDEPKSSPQSPGTERIQAGLISNLNRMLTYAFRDFLMDIAKWLLIGLGLAALIAMLLPDDFFTLYLHNQWLSMLVILAASVPVYVCATGSIPIAAVLMMKGLSPGAALVFLMAGPATNAATLAVIGNTLGRKTLAIYLSSIIAGALFFGFITNRLLPAEWFLGMLSQHAGHQHEVLPYWLKLASGILLGTLIFIGYLRKLIQIKKLKQSTIMNSQSRLLKISVKGMTCNHCKMTVEKNLARIDGIERVNANPEASLVVLEGTHFNMDQIRETVDQIGYHFNGEIE